MGAAYGVYLNRMDRAPAPMSQDFTPEIDAGAVFVCAGPTGLEAAIVFALHPDHLHIDTLAVAPACQGRGLGRALIGWAEDRARQAGLSEARLYTNEVMVENIALYERLGYRQTHPAVMQGYRRIWFSKPL